MKTPTINNPGIVLYLRYKSLTSHEYVIIVRGKVWSSIHPQTLKCITGGYQIKTVDELVSLYTWFTGNIKKDCVLCQTYLINGYNYEEALTILRG